MSITQTGWYYGRFEFHDDEVASQNWNHVVHVTHGHDLTPGVALNPCVLRLLKLTVAQVENAQHQLPTYHLHP